MIEAEVKIKGRCKKCGKSFELFKPFQNHLAYEHDIYVSKKFEVKAKIGKFIKNIRKKVFK